MDRRMVHLARCGLGLCVTLGVVFAVSATQVIAKSFPEIVRDAGVVFQGRCVERRLGRSPQGFLMETYAFRVERCIKGSCPAAGEVYQFSQIGGNRREAAQIGAAFLIGGIPYAEGQEYVLFLKEPTLPPSSAAGNKMSLSAPSPGLTSPIGLGQGVFQVQRSADGKAFVHNAAFDRALSTNAAKELGGTSTALKFSTGLPEASQEGVPLERFIDLVEELQE